MKRITHILILLAIIGLSINSAFAQLFWQGDQYLNNGQTITQNITLIGTTTIWVTSGTATISGIISGAQWLKKEGAGKLILTGVNTYSGYTDVNNGILQVGAGGSGSINPGDVYLASTSSVLRFEPGNTMTFSKSIWGIGKVEYKGGGVLYLAYNNTYTGSTTIESGDLYLGSGNLPAATFTGNINIMSGDLSISRNNDITLTGVISGAGRIWKSGSYTNKLTLTGASANFTGNIYVGNGTVQVGDGTNTTTTIGSVSSVSLVSASSILRFELGASMVFSKVISGAGKVEVKGGVGKGLYFTGASTYTGTTTVESASYLYLGDNTTTGSITSASVINNGEFGFRRTNEYTYSGIISGTGTLNKMSSGKTILIDANTYSGTTLIQGGTLQIGNGTSGSINNTSSVNITSGVLRFEPGASTTFSKVISGAGSVEYKGGGNLYFTANNTYTGTTTVEPGGDFYIGNNGTTGSVAGNIVNNGMLNFSRSNAYTYAGVISGTGAVYVNYFNTNSTLTLNGGNTYSGTTLLYSGTLILGANGTIANSSQVSFQNNAAKLDISAGNKTIKAINSSSGVTGEVLLGARILTIGTSTTSADGGGTFAGVISGTGGITKTGNTDLFLTGNNTYTGATTISTGILWVGSYSATGAIAGNIVNNSFLRFNRSNAYTYNGVISGTGEVRHWTENSATAVLTLGGVNTYTGITYIDGPMVLSANGSIEGSSAVTLTSFQYAKLDISSATKTIKGLNGSNINEVVLGNRTLTIGASGQANGGGNFTGKFTGTGGSVTKNGTATFTMSGTNTATGSFTLLGGMLQFSGTWLGNFSHLASTTLDVIGNANIGGTLSLNGGAINMNLTAATPSKISVTGAFSATGITTLNITSGAVTGAVLIQAQSGINNTSNFTLNMPGFTATLSATGTLLTLTAAVTDVTPPVPGGSGVINGTATADLANLSWTIASDNQTQPNQLRYYVYRSTSNDINTVANCEDNGTLLNSGGTVNITTYMAQGLTPNTNYWFNVIVADLANNKAVYTAKALTTEKAILAGTVTIEGNTVFGETLTANISDLTSIPVSSLGTVSYQWKRNGVNIGSNSNTYTLVVADIANTITVTVTTTNCNGSITSAETAIIQQAEQTAPPAPTMASRTSESITLNTVSDCEYNIDGGPYQSSPLFEGLESNTSYTFTQRKVETPTHLPSPASEPAIFTTEIGISYLGGTVTITGNAVFGQMLTATPNLTCEPPIELGELTYEWERNGVPIGINTTTYTLVQDDIGSEIAVTVTAANCEGSVTSDPTTPVSKATQTAPAAPTMASRTATSITLNIVSGCEYNINGGSYQTSPVFAGLAPNTGYTFTQRMAETSTHWASPASESATFTTDIASGNIYTIAANVNNLAMGIITPYGEAQVEEGGSITFTITPYSGYIIEDVYVNGASAGDVSSYTFSNVQANATIIAMFKERIVGVEELGVSSIQVYPNPTRGELRVTSYGLQVTDIEVFDVFGRKQKAECRMQNAEILMDIANLPTGTYMLRMQTDNGIITKKVVKQ